MAIFGQVSNLAMGLGITAALPGAMKIGGHVARGTLSPALRLATGGSLGRAVLGAGIGGAVGAFGTDYQNPNNIFESIVKGAAFGAAGGAVASRLPRLALGAGRLAVRGGARAVGPLGKAALGAGRFAFEHPLLVGGLAAGAYGAAILGAPEGSPTLTGARVSQRYGQQEVAAMKMTGGTGTIGGGMVGSAPRMMSTFHRGFQQSTVGLVGGLNRARHG